MTLGQVRSGQSPDPRYQRWLQEEVAYIITEGERAAFLQLTDDQSREQFMAQFWLGRDPTPATTENEAKTEHYRRLSYANARFGSGETPGWKTSKGRVYIVYGPPREIESYPSRDLERWRYGAGFLADMTLEFQTTARQ